MGLMGSGKSVIGKNLSKNFHFGHFNKVLYNGGRVIAATPAVFERIKHFTERAMRD